MTATCIGCTSGSPKNCRASSGVQSISTFTFMCTPDCSDSSRQYRREKAPDASGLIGRYGSYPLVRLVWSTKARGGKGRRIGERRFAGHHLGQQPASRRTQRQPVVLVSEIEPEPGMARRLADDRQHIGQARPRPLPGPCVDRLSQWEQGTRPRQCLLDLDRRGGGVPTGKLHPGGEPNAAVHRREQKAEIKIENGMIEHGVAARRQVQVVTPFDSERKGISERTKYQIGPWSER